MMDDTRDRVIRLESEVKHLTDSVNEMSDKIAQMHDLLNQAKGAKWILAALWLGFGGAGTAIVIKLLSLVGFRMG